MRGGGVNWQTRGKGSDKEGKDGKGDGDVTVLAVMDGATVMAMEPQLSSGAAAAAGWWLRQRGCGGSATAGRRWRQWG